MLSVDAQNVVASAFKQSKDGTSVLRVYESAGQAAKAVRVTLRFNLKQLHEANLIEDKGAPLRFDETASRLISSPLRSKRSNYPLELLWLRNRQGAVDREFSLIQFPLLAFLISREADEVGRRSIFRYATGP